MFLAGARANVSLVLTMLIVCAHVALVPAAAQTPLGTNLSAVTYFSPEQPFLNILKTGGGWAGAAAGIRYDQSQGVFTLDANGYPTSMNGIGPAAGQTFTEIDTLVLRNVGVSGGTSAPFYNAGQYVVLYDGEGTLGYDFDAIKNTSLSTVGATFLISTRQARMAYG